MNGIVDDRSGASVITFLSHWHAHHGRMYEISYKTPDGSGLADNSNLDFLFVSGESDIHFSFGAIAANPIEVVFYENTTITNVGTSLSVVGLNRVKTIGSTSRVYHSPTVATVGNQLAINLQVWGLSPLTSAFSNVDWILKQNINYMLRIVNRAGSTQDVGMIMQWFEED